MSSKRRASQQEQQDEARSSEEPCSSSSLPAQAQKRARFSSESAEQVPRFRHAQQVVRPGIPNPIRLSDFKLADKPSPPLRGDDKEGHYNYELGENISSRYKILSKFGEGTFGRVLECWDRKFKDYVAVKIVRNVDKYRHAAMIELEVLNTLEKNDPESKRNCVKLKEWFQYRGHVCMVFEKLGPSLYDYLRRNEYQPLPLAMVQSMARQLLVAVAFIHELGLVHTDLKPENILLVAQEHVKLPAVAPATVERRVPRDSTIKVIDFGSATFEDGYHSSIISTRHYRAPEVILGLGWSYPCDLWSCGCILVELAVGDALFQTHENLEHLAMMQQVLGPIPESMASCADKHSARYFTTAAQASGSTGGNDSSAGTAVAPAVASAAAAPAAPAAAPGSRLRLAWPEGATRKSLRAVRRLADLRALLAGRADQAGVPGAAEAVEALASLIEGLLRYDPATRTSAVEALQHEFFSIQLDMPIGEGATPEPSAATAAAAATMATLPLRQQPHLQVPLPVVVPADLQQQAAAAVVAGVQQQVLLQLQQAGSLYHMQAPSVTGVSGDVAAEAVAARAAQQAAAAGAGPGQGVDAMQLLPAVAAAAAAGSWAAAGVQQLLQQQQFRRPQQQQLIAQRPQQNYAYAEEDAIEQQEEEEAGEGEEEGEEEEEAEGDAEDDGDLGNEADEQDEIEGEEYEHLE